MLKMTAETFPETQVTLQLLARAVEAFGVAAPWELSLPT